MQQRYYDPVIGRFYSNDPVGFSADKPMMFNRYAYGNNNPYKFNDPTGMTPEVIEIKMPDVSEVLANSLGFESATAGNESINKAVDNTAEAVKDASPSRETMQTVGTAASIGLTVAAVTKPCTAMCANGALAINTAMAADNVSQGNYTGAALNMLPAAAGKATSVLVKGGAQISKENAGAIVDSTLSVVDAVRPKDK